MSELFGYSLLAFGAGLLLNFVPCVLPVIPIKIQTFAVLISSDGKVAHRFQGMFSAKTLETAIRILR